MKPLATEDADLLLELSNVGAGHATTTLSRLVGRRRVALSVPRLQFLSRDRLLTAVGSPSGDIVAIRLVVSGVLEAEVALVFTRSQAERLATLVVQSADGAPAPVERSALLELGNIVTSAYLNALARLVGARLLPSPPELVEGAPEVVLGLLSGRAEEDGVLVLVNEFGIESERFIGYFLLFPSPESLRACLLAARSVS